MVISCCHVQCAIRQGCKPNLAFYRVPFDADRRWRWIAAINRKDWQPSKYSRICNEHFLRGKKSDDPLSPDYVPSVFAHMKTPEKRRAQKSLEKYEVREAMRKRKSQESSKTKAARALLDLSAEKNGPVLAEAENEATVSDKGTNSKCDAMCQTDLTSEDIESLQYECQQLRGETFTLKEKLKSSDLPEQGSFENNDKLKTLTGLHLFSV
ncbi:peroxynitrite isomerase THAP4-like [Lampris incognitus]|uniref:peroxynitrite isomerase THAP4-like n=1 Tax=Lampris incognitus TaxID=2546036 RepID=UPI0024B608BE|nr:peroxynitrite isomerase THAP4-like [Lampris incognitus]